MNENVRPGDIVSRLPDFDTSTPVLILGGQENALSLVRRYGRLGITTRYSGEPDRWAHASRFCAKSYPVPKGVRPQDYWSDLLLGTKPPELQGSIIIYGNDAAIQFVAGNRDALERHYVLDHSRPELQLALLDKLETLRMARQAGIATPKHWVVESIEDIAAIRDEIRLPAIVKPLISHEFTAIFRTKFFVIRDNVDELAEKIRLCFEHNQPVMVVEHIPGPDTLLTSYYTYIDDKGELLYDYTKQVIRRYPKNMGGACYHASTWDSETAEAGRKFFKGIGFTGLGNIEFKRDLRDNELKIIEVNARFTAAQELVVRSGAPIDIIYYCRLTNQPIPRFSTYDQNVRLWYSLRDVLAFNELRQLGELSVAGFIASTFPFNHVSPLHQLTDPWPTIGTLRHSKFLRFGRRPGTPR